MSEHQKIRIRELTHENARLRQELERLRGEIERLRADCQRMWLFIAEQHCECYDEYGNKRPNECERCQIMRAASAAGGGE